MWLCDNHSHHFLFSIFIPYWKNRRLQHVSMLPDGGLIMVKDNDIYYKSTIKTSAVERLTTSGVSGAVYNGVTDWLYEEEILGSAGALWPSRSGARLAYLSFNDTEVDLITLRNFSPDEGTKPGDKVRVRYPKVRASPINRLLTRTIIFLAVVCKNIIFVILLSQQSHKNVSKK